jgi:hypothetical protein
MLTELISARMRDSTTIQINLSRHYLLFIGKYLIISSDNTWIVIKNKDILDLEGGTLVT